MTSRRSQELRILADSRICGPCTVDDTSALVQYAPADAWAHESGQDAQAYVNSTFTRTAVEGATAKFSFEGTGFWLYGAKQKDYGQYILILDEQVTRYDNAASEDAQAQQVLGGASGLENKQHTVVLMSAGGGPVDIDAIVYETTDQEQMYVTLEVDPLLSFSMSSVAAIPRPSSLRGMMLPQALLVAPAPSQLVACLQIRELWPTYMLHAA